MILVTGGGGFLGSHLVRRLVAEGEAVRVLVRDPMRLERERRLAGLSVEIAQGDVTRPESLGPAVRGAQAVIHTAAIAIERGEMTYERVNHQGTVHLVDACKQAGIRRFLNVSQLGAAPDLPYRFLASKGGAQAHVAQSGLEWTAFRPSVIWGPEDEFANTFARLIPLTPLIFPRIGGEAARFQPVWVEDVVSVILACLRDASTTGEEYELGGPEILTLGEMERRILEAVGARRLLIPFPMPGLRLAVRVMEALLPNPPVTSSLLELLGVSNVTAENALPRFVADPRPFAPRYLAEYMRAFKVGDTLRQYLGRA